MDALKRSKAGFLRWQNKVKTKKDALEVGVPVVILLEHDEYDASFIGCTQDGRQFFLTTPFVPGAEGNEFVALYTFDMKGNLIGHVIDELGPRSSLDMGLREQIRLQRLKELGNVSYCSIGIRPFLIERNGIVFGLIPHPPTTVEDGWTASVEPGDYMSFSPPWDYGHYDT